MTMQLRKATRQKAKIRLGLSAASGGGKTVSALLIAYGITGDWDKIAVIDTENGSADLYANHTLPNGFTIGEFQVLPFGGPYPPEAYIKCIKDCEAAGMEVVIIDSITHEWDGDGGILRIADSMTGDSFSKWKILTPRHQAFIDTILRSRCHIITTVRRKQEYALTKDESTGKNRVEKLGLKEITRDGFDYELTLNFELDQNHNAWINKDRTGLFDGKPFFIPTPDTGRIISEWCEAGVDFTSQIQDAIAKVAICNSQEEIELLVETLPVLVSQHSTVVDAVNRQLSLIRSKVAEADAATLGNEIQKSSSPEDLTALRAKVNALPEPHRSHLRSLMAANAETHGYVWNAESQSFEAAKADAGPVESEQKTEEQSEIGAPPATEADSKADVTPAGDQKEEKTVDQIIEEYKPLIQAVETPDGLTEMLKTVNNLPNEAAKSLRRTVSAKAKSSGWMSNAEKTGFVVDPSSDSASQQQQGPEKQARQGEADPQTTEAPKAEAQPVAQSQKLEWFTERVGRKIWMQGSAQGQDHYTGIYPPQPGVVLSDKFPDYLVKLQQTEGYAFRDMTAEEAESLKTQEPATA